MHTPLGSLILLPNSFDDNQPLDGIIPCDHLKKMVQGVEMWVFESRRSGFRMIAKLKEPHLKAIPYIELNEHTKEGELKEIQAALLSGKTIGLISDAGLPCLADPGANLVLFCHLHKIKVKHVTGPSSIPIAVMLSGLNGQRFFFDGYLPKNEQERKERILELIVRSEKEKTTMVFIEAPYRNKQLFELFNQLLPKKAYLSIACDLTLDTEIVYTAHPGQFKLDIESIQDRPAIFLFGMI